MIPALDLPPTALVLFGRVGPEAKPLGLDRRDSHRLTRALLGATLNTLASFTDRARLVLALDGPPDAELGAFIAAHPAVVVLRQRGATFEARLIDALARTRDLGHARLVVVGADVPALGPADLEAALAPSHGGELVIGPSFDGGCYLIGLDAVDLDLLAGLPWRRPTLLRALLDRLGQHRRPTRLIAARRDVDDGWDVSALRRPLERLCGGPLCHRTASTDARPRRVLRLHAFDHQPPLDRTGELPRPPPCLSIA